MHNKISKSYIIMLLITLIFIPLQGKKPKHNINLRGFEKFANQIIKDWEVPGTALAIVKDGQLIYARGFGFRHLEKKLPVSPNTLFAIGSCSKAFTATALGMMVDRNKLDWEKPVVNYLPAFRLKDPIAAQQMTTVDLMCHRSGLPRHDLSWYNASVTRQQLFNRLLYLEPTKSFRAQFQYNNFMFLTAGILLEKLSGMSWESFIKENIFTPLKMKNSNFSVLDSQKSADFSLPYAIFDKKITAIPFRNIDTMGPAGSINSSVNEMANWLILNLNKGKFNKKELIADSTLLKIHSPQMITGSTLSPYQELFYNFYGLGWGITSYRGALLVSHGGGIDGFVSNVSFLPRKNTGIVILTNSSSGGGAVCTILTNNLYDRILKKKQVSWNIRLKLRRKKTREEQKKVNKEEKKIPGTKPSHPLKNYIGRYENPGYGILKVDLKENKLLFTFNSLKLYATHYHYDIFNLTSKDLNIEKMLVSFQYDKDGNIIKVLVPLQSGIKDIEFTKLGDEKMRSKAFLEKFTGQYEFLNMIATVSFKDDHTLKLTVPGQPVYELVPLKGTEFKLKNLEGYCIEFVIDKSGKVTEAKAHQPNGTFTSKKIK